jgi:hypothetical protein
MQWLGPLDQHAWHKNIAVATAERLHEQDFAARTGSTPGAGLNKSGRAAGAPSFAQRRVGLSERAKRAPKDPLTDRADAHTSAHPGLALLTEDGAPVTDEIGELEQRVS